MLALVLLLMAGGRLISQYSESDFPLTADPNAAQWKGIAGVHADEGTEVRSRWTKQNLYLLFVCPYDRLYLHPNPATATETNQLWNWDVAEAFIGSDFAHIRQYKEFEVSPQGEWVDLDIDRDHPKPEGGWRWNSGFHVEARIDAAAKVWYAEMQIPIASIDTRPPRKGLEMRINLYRCQGPPPNRKYIAWQPTGQSSFHVPEAFGRLVLE